jgi:hypothetical protein
LPAELPPLGGAKMTAEVAVLNKSGVALAADSAVTTGFPGQEKIFTTANKIFTLSKVHPVGIMINGHVEHFGCPWEVIIKDFRSHIGDRSFADLREYVDLFTDTIRNPRFISDDGQAASVIATSISNLGELGSRLEDEGRGWTAADIQETLEEMTTFAKTRPHIPGFEHINYSSFEAKVRCYC